MTVKTTTIDLDSSDELAFLSYDEPVHTKRVKLFGADWDVRCDINTFALGELLVGGGAGELSRYLLDFIVEEQRPDFAAKLRSLPNLDGERIGKIIFKLMEVAGERPTKPSALSPRTASKRTSSPKSGTSSRSTASRSGR